MRLGLLAVVALFAAGCAPTVSQLGRLSPQLRPAEVQRRIGAPPRQVQQFVGRDGRNYTLWEYKLYLYSGAIEDVSPYFEVYTLVFVDDRLVQWMKTGGPSEDDYRRAAAFVTAVNAAAASTTRAMQPTYEPPRPTYYAPPRGGYASGSATLACGIKPIPDIGCRIGRCVDGAWEQVCDSAPMLTCGIRPIPDIGCRIGRCVDGAWEQICDSAPTLSCGIKPIPEIGCHIGRCVDGAWEQVCI